MQSDRVRHRFLDEQWSTFRMKVQACDAVSRVQAALYTPDESGKGLRVVKKSGPVARQIRASIDLGGMDPIQIRRQRPMDSVWRSSTIESWHSHSGSLSSIEELPEAPRSRCSSSQGASQVQTAAHRHALQGTSLKSHRIRGAIAGAQADKGAPAHQAEAELASFCDLLRSQCSFPSCAKVHFFACNHEPQSAMAPALLGPVVHQGFPSIPQIPLQLNQRHDSSLSEHLVSAVPGLPSWQTEPR